MPAKSAPKASSDEARLRNTYESSLALHREGRLEDAERGYLEILGQRPDNFHALHMLGVLHGQREDWIVAERLIAGAVKANPRSAAARANLGNAQRLLGQSDAALHSYEKALDIDPDNIRALKGRGLLLHQAGRPAEALYLYDRLLTLEPGYRDGRIIRAVCLEKLGLQDRAVADYAEALDLDTSRESETLRYFMASRGIGEVPATSPADYVRDLFDAYARTFDQHLVGQLNYRAPEILFDAVRPHLSASPQAMVDLGCGTGLCGPLLRPHASRLVGVDLSGGMLEKARVKGLYDELVEADLVDWLARQPAAFDIAIAADVVLYFGDVGPLFAASRDALRPGGVFAFSTESCEGTEPLLNNQLRYAHPDAYLRRMAEAGGWSVVSQTARVIREEKGEGVLANLTVLRRD